MRHGNAAESPAEAPKKLATVKSPLAKTQDCLLRRTDVARRFHQSMNMNSLLLKITRHVLGKPCFRA
jgi:hypothetical protein